jgi:hypothetical protein
MVKAKDSAVKNSKNVSNRNFVCGLVEVSSDRIKFKLNADFLITSESGVTGIIPLDSEDEAANIDKMQAAAEYFKSLAQDLRQAAELCQSGKTESVTPAQTEPKPLNPQQQAEHLAMIHGILEELPDVERELYQKFGFGERAELYKKIDYETDPVKLQGIVCAMIKAIAAHKN